MITAFVAFVTVSFFASVVAAVVASTVSTTRAFA
jgi:hypothetical protein